MQQAAAAFSTPENQIRATGSGNSWTLTNYRNGQAGGNIDITLRPQSRTMTISSGNARSRGTRQGGGTNFYEAAMAYAYYHNLESTSGTLLEINRFRRTALMLSSALRFGTTRHIYPSSEQGIQSQWTRGDDIGNIVTMARKEMDHVHQHFPVFDNWRYDIASASLLDEHGNPRSATEVKQLIKRSDPSHANGVGFTTVARATATRQIIHHGASGDSSGLGGGQGPGRVSGQSILYSLLPGEESAGTGAGTGEQPAA